MLYLASDHAGFKLKHQLKEFLTSQKIKFTDLGPFEYKPDDDYPDYILPAAIKVGERSNHNKAIILGGSGQGEAMVANKVKGVRAVVYYGGSQKIITLSRTHNNANILSLGARFISSPLAKQVIKLWLNTKFPQTQRHLRRIKKITNYQTN